MTEALGRYLESKIEPRCWWQKYLPLQRFMNNGKDPDVACSVDAKRILLELALELWAFRLVPSVTTGVNLVTLENASPRFSLVSPEPRA